MLPTISMEPIFDIEGDDQKLREALVAMLTSKSNSSARLELPQLLPKFLKVSDKIPNSSHHRIYCQFAGKKHWQRIESHSSIDER